jgi:WD40 repeat protein
LSILFISHSRHDNAAAVRIRDWLKENGWGEVFLDLDPERGMTPGRVWQQELKQAGERCAGVLVLLSPDWVNARWCQTEFLVADQLGKKIFPIFIAPTPFDDVPVELRTKYQILDISRPETEIEGFERLELGLKRAGLHPSNFEWPPPSDPARPIYRGLQSLDEQDAAIFFGRDAQVTKGLDALRRLRDGAPERMLVILGASGAGKSSFLKAGLIARLKRDEENFLVLPIIRPERAAMSGEHGLAACLSRKPGGLNAQQDVQDAFTAFRAHVTDRLHRYAEYSRDAAHGAPATIVIPIDQAEEFFAAENTEAARALELLTAAVLADRNAIIVATIRSDAFGRMQDSAALADVPVLTFSLAPMPHGAFTEVIEGPARLTNPPLSVEPALTEQLLKDLATDDALPLLAFTLSQLLSHARNKRALTLADYARELGGLHGAILSAVEAAFAKAQRDPALPHDRIQLEKLARAAFIPSLVQIDDADSEPKRRVERLEALPEPARPLIRHFIDTRLLLTDRRVIDGNETDTIEVAHEAILRQWPALRSWIAEEREALLALDGVRAAAQEWKTHGSASTQESGWLTHAGGRLEEAERLLAPAHFANALGSMERDYLVACRAQENTVRERERGEIERQKKNIVRTRRLQRNIFALIGAAVAIVLLAGFGIAELLKGIATRSSDALSKLSEQAADNQDYEGAARYAIAGLAGADWRLLGYPGLRATVALRGADTLSSRIAVLRGHGDVVESAAYSPDGRRIVTASNDKTARIWDAATGAQLAVLRGHDDAVTSAAYSPDGRRIVTTSLDKTARVWDATTGAQLAVLRGHDSGVASAAYSPDGTRIVTASADKTARIWDATTGAQLTVLRGHGKGIEAAAYSPDGRRIATASDDNTARIWDATTGAPLGVLSGHDAAVNSVAYSPDGTRIVTSSEDGSARIWDAASKAQLTIRRGHHGATVLTAAYSSDGARIVTASLDKTASIWDAATGAQLAVLRGHADGVYGAAFNPAGTRVVTASVDKTARIWDAHVGAQLAVLRGHEAYALSAAYSPDGARIASTSEDTTVRIWDAQTGAPLAVLRGHEGDVETVAYSPDGGRIVTASFDKTARIWNARSGALIAVLRGHNRPLSSAAYSHDGTRIVTASGDGTARIWDARTGARLAILRAHSTVESVSYNPQDTRIATALSDKTARIWDAATGAQLAVLRGHDGIVDAIAYSPDGSRIVTASLDKTARIWDATTGAQLAVLRGHDAGVYAAAYGRDGARIVTASVDKTARIWDAVTGAQLAVLRGHDDAVTSAAYSPDGTRIVTASNDKTVRIWRAPHIDPSLLSLPRNALIARTCATVLSYGLDHFSNEELATAPDLDPKLDADACHPTTLWARLRELFLASAAH